LVENPEGISLAQLPKFIQEKINFQLNIPELGFAKLKDLLAAMEDVLQVKFQSTNKARAFLKKEKN